MTTSMLRYLTLIMIALTLCNCTRKSAEVRVTSDAAVAEVQAKSRSEPIFYNGKTYQFNLDPVTGGRFALSVSPMSPAQQNDAVALATSSLGYYACVSGKAGKLVDKPEYAVKTWKMTAVCN
jgi:hypothetical protein